MLEESYKNGTFAAAYNVSTPPTNLSPAAPGGWASTSRTKRPCSAETRITTAFDQNNQRLPYLDELVFLVVPDQDAADLKFRAGGVDALDDVKPENYRWYEDNQKKGNFTLV